GRGVRQRVRERHRAPQAAHLLPEMGGRDALAEAASYVSVGGGRDAEGGADAVATAGCRGQGARPVGKRAHRIGGEAVNRPLALMCSVSLLVAGCSAKT